jgi:hypothetical protein
MSQRRRFKIRMDHSISHHYHDLLLHHLIRLFLHSPRNHHLVHRLMGFKPKPHFPLRHTQLLMVSTDKPKMGVLYLYCPNCSLRMNLSAQSSYIVVRRQ